MNTFHHLSSSTMAFFFHFVSPMKHTAKFIMHCCASFLGGSGDGVFFVFFCDTLCILLIYSTSSAGAVSRDSYETIIEITATGIVLDVTSE